MGKPIAEPASVANGHPSNGTSNGSHHSSANGQTNGHSNGSTANGKAANGHMPTKGEEQAESSSFFSIFTGGKRKSSASPTPSSQPNSQGGTPPGNSPPKTSVRGRRYSGIIHANGVHRDCFADDGISLVVESVTEKVRGISTGEYSPPPMSPATAINTTDGNTADGQAFTGPVFKFPIARNGRYPSPAPKAHLSIFGQRMDRPLFAVAFYSALHYFASRVIVPRVPGFGSVTGNDKVFLPEKLPSTVNALVVGIGALYTMSKRGIFWGEGVDKLNAWSEEVDMVFSSHMGFTIYDTYIMAALGGEHPSVWAHHVLGILGTIIVRAYKKLAWFPMCFSVSELTVVPSNALWIQQKVWPSRKDVEGKLLALRAIFFALFRTPDAVISVLGALAAIRKEPNLVNRAKNEVPLFVSALCAFNVAVFGGLNFWWTALVLKAVLRHRNAVAGQKTGGAILKTLESVAGGADAVKVVHHI